MLNPMVEEIYGKRTAECFQLLAEEAQKRNNYVGLYGIKSMKNVTLPEMVCFDKDDLDLNEMVVNVFVNTSVSLSLLEQDAFDYLPYVAGRDIWGESDKEMIDLWVR